MRHGEFSETQHDQIHHEGADQVSQHGAEGADVGNDMTRSKKESAADHAAKTQHDKVAQLHRALKLGLVVRRNLLGAHNAFPPKCRCCVLAPRVQAFTQGLRILSSTSSFSLRS